MAVFNSNDVTVSIGGVLLTDHITSVDFGETSAELDTTTMGSSNITRIGGLKDGNVSLEFLQDFAATEVYATLNPLLGTLTTVIVTPTDAAAAADNPEKSVSCLVTEVPFIASGVADLATISVSWPMSGPVTTATA
tara:strand:+ start:518 stop:925 length:408 start_codon:yes stop_codon:yes gene_type:complete